MGTKSDLRQFVEGKVKPGGMLPRTSALAKRFGVSMKAAYRWLASLASEGLVEQRSEKGIGRRWYRVDPCAEPRRPAALDLLEWVDRVGPGQRLGSRQKVMDELGLARRPFASLFRLFRDHGVLEIRLGKEGGVWTTDNPPANARAALVELIALESERRALAAAAVQRRREVASSKAVEDPPEVKPEAKRKAKPDAEPKAKPKAKAEAKRKAKRARRPAGKRGRFLWHVGAQRTVIEAAAWFGTERVLGWIDNARPGKKKKPEQQDRVLWYPGEKGGVAVATLGNGALLLLAAGERRDALSRASASLAPLVTEEGVRAPSQDGLRLTRVSGLTRSAAREVKGGTLPKAAVAGFRHAFEHRGLYLPAGRSTVKRNVTHLTVVTFLELEMLVITGSGIGTAGDFAKREADDLAALPDRLADY